MKKKIDDYDQYRWKDGLICFNDEPFDDIMDTINWRTVSVPLFSNRYSGQKRKPMVSCQSGEKSKSKGERRKAAWKWILRTVSFWECPFW